MGLHIPNAAIERIGAISRKKPNTTTKSTYALPPTEKPRLDIEPTVLNATRMEDNPLEHMQLASLVGSQGATVNQQNRILTVVMKVREIVGVKNELQMMTESLLLLTMMTWMTHPKAVGDVLE